jgi:hypothetical protein
MGNEIKSLSIANMNQDDLILDAFRAAIWHKASYNWVLRKYLVDRTIALETRVSMLKLMRPDGSQLHGVYDDLRAVAASTLAEALEKSVQALQTSRRADADDPQKP